MLLRLDFYNIETGEYLPDDGTAQSLIIAINELFEKYSCYDNYVMFVEEFQKSNEYALFADSISDCDD